jgi:hypothetical protein
MLVPGTSAKSLRTNLRRITPNYEKELTPSGGRIEPGAPFTQFHRMSGTSLDARSVLLRAKLYRLQKNRSLPLGGSAGLQPCEKAQQVQGLQPRAFSLSRKTKPSCLRTRLQKCRKNATHPSKTRQTHMSSPHTIKNTQSCADKQLKIKPLNTKK